MPGDSTESSLAVCSGFLAHAGRHRLPLLPSAPFVGNRALCPTGAIMCPPVPPTNSHPSFAFIHRRQKCWASGRTR
jgi:hypothetical protein